MVNTYNIYRDGSLVGTTTGSSYTNTGLTNGQQYAFQVSAVNVVGEGPRAGPILATPNASQYTPSSPLVITSSNTTIQDKSFSSGLSGFGIHAYGSAGSRLSNITIRHCSFSGFYGAIWAEYINNLIIEQCTINDTLYSGVMVLGCVGGRVNTNLIQRIGVGQPNDTNAYGIAFSDNQDGVFTTDMTADGNIIEDVPTWQGMNTHNGQRLTWTNNVVRRTRRAFWLAPTNSNRIVSCTVSNNRAENPSPVTYDPTGYFIMNSDNSSVTNNFISTGYPVGSDGGDWLNYIRDYGSGSTNLTRSGNVRG